MYGGSHSYSTASTAESNEVELHSLHAPRMSLDAYNRHPSFCFLRSSATLPIPPTAADKAHVRTPGTASAASYATVQVPNQLSCVMEHPPITSPTPPLPTTTASLGLCVPASPRTLPRVCSAPAPRLACRVVSCRWSTVHCPFELCTRMLGGL
ncbi:hypothetical protein EJ06DRAFT_139301 [Trichodelitschia bisporula]|uniref:Uncharacterized protein n=1 Tax=Trichodelitschia bisporula TaxID=703511 RepID=A0A6G1HPF4_9PEZI|nr:hypothetical protein EJ06DRAFT_139301 [Trichodelitschia bisporula]